MHSSAVARAVTAATAVCEAQGLEVDRVAVLHNSNKLTIRLEPADIVARVGCGTYFVDGFEFEIGCAQRLVGVGAPVGALDPRVPARVYEPDGFVITLWTHHRPDSLSALSSDRYADALGRLHAAMRSVDLVVPHFTDRVQSAQDLVADPVRTPALTDADRELLADALQELSMSVREQGGDQLLHGEPHPGNLLDTADGLLFIDLETCCRGPVEFDLAHAPAEVADHYPGVDHGLLTTCRLLVLAMITSWRWDVDDQFPNGRQVGAQWLEELRTALADRERLSPDG